MTKAAFNEFLKILNDKFGIHPNQTHWENARDEFLNLTLENNRKFNMAFARSYCIDDLENDGCKIIKKESNQEKITAIINFEKQKVNYVALLYLLKNEILQIILQMIETCALKLIYLKE